MTARPRGVTIVAILTVIAVVALLFFCLLLFVLAAVGGAANAAADGGMPLWLLAWISIPFALAILALLVAIGILKGTKYAGYASMVLWIALFVYFGWYALRIISNLSFQYAYELETALVTAVPLIYSVGCLVYFQTQRIKEYFGLSP